MNAMTNNRFRRLITENYPSLAQSGGFDFLRCVPNTKRLELFSEVAQSNPKVLQERSCKGKVFVRPVQQDLILSPAKKPRLEPSADSDSDDDDFAEACFHCGQRVPLPQLRTHIRLCSVKSRSRHNTRDAEQGIKESDAGRGNESDSGKEAMEQNGEGRNGGRNSSEESTQQCHGPVIALTRPARCSSSQLLSPTTSLRDHRSTYGAFLDLMVSSESGTSSSDEGAEFMGLQSAIALSLQESTHTTRIEVQFILKNHRDRYISEAEDAGLCIAVRRRHLWNDAKLVLSRQNNAYSMGMRVTFVSEAAVDEGGPRREFFRLALADLACNNALFDGPLHRRIVRHNVIELQGNAYLIVGRIIALSLIYGGPAPQFFAKAAAEYLLDVSPCSVSLEDVPDNSVQQSLLQLQQVKTCDKMRELLDGDLFDLRCACGISMPSSSLKLKDVPRLVRSFCLHFIIYSAKSELDQVKEGLGTVNLLSVMQNNSSQFLPMFLGSYRTELTADTLLGLFTVKEWSPEGSNSREAEEAVMFNWENYIRETEGGRVIHGSDEEVHLSNILVFVSGTNSIPPLGFPSSPVILFSKDTGRLLPTASTCALSLTLSIGLAQYDLFQQNMDLAVLNAFEFGQV